MKKRTGKLIAASPAVSADVLYAGGFNAPDEVIYFEAGREKGLILSQLEYARGRQEARKTVSVLNRESFLEDSNDRSDQAVLLNLSRRCGITEWLVPGDFPLLIADFLRSNGIGVLPAKSEFMPKRLVKTASELREIAKAEAVTAAAPDRNKIPAAAPALAPEETPITSGDARGLRNTVW